MYELQNIFLTCIFMLVICLLPDQISTFVVKVLMDVRKHWRTYCLLFGIAIWIWLVHSNNNQIRVQLDDLEGRVLSEIDEDHQNEKHLRTSLQTEIFKVKEVFTKIIMMEAERTEQRFESLMKELAEMEQNLKASNRGTIEENIESAVEIKISMLKSNDDKIQKKINDILIKMKDTDAITEDLDNRANDLEWKVGKGKDLYRKLKDYINYLEERNYQFEEDLDNLRWNFRRFQHQKENEKRASEEKESERQRDLATKKKRQNFFVRALQALIDLLSE